MVALLAADMLLGDERRWQGLTPEGTVAFFEDDSPSMLVLSQLELHDSIDSCCSAQAASTCHDAYVFRSPLHPSVRLDLFNFQQNGPHSENDVVKLLRRGGYELFNPCFEMPLLHNHVSGHSTKQTENRCNAH